MENLKIRINNENESQEAQELFFKIGYSWFLGKCKGILKFENSSSLFMFAYSEGDLTHSGSLALFNYKTDFKEITLQQLREMVEPKMKEFLNSKAGYILQVLPKHAGDDPESGLIEVPVGANYAYENDQGICFLNSELSPNHPLLLWQRDKPVSTKDKKFFESFDDLPKVENKHNHYFIDVSDVDEVDFYEIAKRYNVTDPAIQHILKKCLAVGGRGHKNFEEDLLDIYKTAKRALVINGVDNG